MKTSLNKSILLLALLAIAFQSRAQAPKKFNYQMAVRDAQGEMYSNQQLSFRVSIMEGSTILYQEIHNTQTNAFGLVNLIVGEGTNTLGNIAAIDWGNEAKSLKVEFDPNGGSSYAELAATPLLSVPYALHAKTTDQHGLWNTLEDNIYFNAGNVGIGTSRPGYKLTVEGGDATINTLTIGRGNKSSPMFQCSAFGFKALYTNISGSFNTALGEYSLHDNTTGSYNTATGAGTLSNNTTGRGNTAYGSHALNKNTTGRLNVAVGVGALYQNTNRSCLIAIGDSALFNNGLTVNNESHATYNIAIGSKALFSNTLGSYNTAIGAYSLHNVATGVYNTAVGYEALMTSTHTNEGNTAIGAKALKNNTTGYYNVAIGYLALERNTTGSGNVAVGLRALYLNTTGERNTAIGHSAKRFGETGNDNTAVGHSAVYGSSFHSGYSNTGIGSQALSSNDGVQNTALGHFAGSVGTGSYNTFVGYGTKIMNMVHFSNVTCLGIEATATASDQVRIGNTLIQSIGGYQNWTNVSDGRFEKEVKENVPGLAFINILRPVTFVIDREGINEAIGLNKRREQIKAENPNVEFLTGERYSEVTTGFIAQEVEAAAQQIGFTFSGVDAPKNENDFYGLRYAEFVVPLVKAVQEQQALIDAQQKTIDELLKRIEALERE